MRLTRRQLLAGTGALAITTGSGCPVQHTLAPAGRGAVTGNHAEVGHLLRDRTSWPEPNTTHRCKVLVVGGGVAGLSAIWRLRAAGIRDIQLIEMAPQVGGTARSAGTLPYPLGAHYLPVPNPETTLTLRLLRELGLAEGDGDDLRFDERHLVHAPEDRLFFRGGWYPGLFLQAGASAEDRAQLAAFEALTAQLREARGSDGRLAFAIPTALSSRDPRYTALDSITMRQFLDERGLTSPRVRWTVGYACRDDYGAGIDHVSAWAGLHYFAGRRPIQRPETRGTTYFTWPEGNGRLVRHLRRFVPETRTRLLAVRVGQDGEVLARNSEGGMERFLAEQVVVATPSHVSAKLTGGLRRAVGQHAPWLVANIAFSEPFPAATGAWNNVLYESPSVGFVEANHQRFGPTPTHWTWYRPYPVAQRGALLSADYHQLAREVLDDLKAAFGDVLDRVSYIDLWRWGHGTLIPTPGVQFGGGREQAAESWGKAHFAHTDLSGLPLFEEAQFRGVLAAERVLRDLSVTRATWLG